MRMALSFMAWPCGGWQVETFEAPTECKYANASPSAVQQGGETCGGGCWWIERVLVTDCDRFWGDTSRVTIAKAAAKRSNQPKPTLFTTALATRIWGKACMRMFPVPASSNAGSNLRLRREQHLKLPP
ncbi:hypothetical protein BCR44DRAFT_1458031 [Catenaria anguillulae PL171]|uniref:Uncharacterized protein n=1 Tax=Catenaria anguillulae PL171 TaxID=765915 RepID=A0A1Y2HZF6_9FUNG|nr:hypothetical protein BCR44DRAFT_1458031 [Catenaria anguillulae PL171]